MRIYLQNTDGNRIYNEVKWNEKKIWWVCTLRKFLNFYPPPPTSCKKDSYWWVFLWHWKMSGLKKDLLQKQAHQPHSEMHLPHVSTNGCLCGWWALFAALNLALINSFGTPQLNPERLHVHQYVALRSWSGSCWSRHSGRACRTWNFGSCGLLRGLLGNGGTRANAGSRWRRLGQEMVGAWSDSPQKSI